jgi:hypothetical protein
MTSTAILMAMGTAQTSVHPAKTDLGERDIMSFAQSLDERVDTSGSMLGKSSTSEAAIGSRIANDETAVKITNLAATVSHGMKGQTIPTRQEPEHNEVKGEGDGKIFTPQTATAPVKQTKTTVRDPEMKDIKSPAEVEWATEDNSIGQGAKALNFKEEALLPQPNATNEDRLSASRGEAGVVQKAIATIGKTLDVVPGKKTTKSQKEETEPMGSQQITTTLHPITIVAKTTSGSVEQNSEWEQRVVIASTPADADSAIPKGEINITPDGNLGHGASVTGKNSLEGTIVTKDSLARKDVSDGKTPGIEGEKGLPFIGDPGGSSKPSAEVEKLPAGTNAASDGITVKTENASVPVAAIVHATAGSTGGVITPGNVPSDTSFTKLTVGEAGAHTAGLPDGLKEQDSSDTVAGWMDGMPQTLTASPTALEVGIQNGTHGWLKVRAEMTDGGVVNASVSAASTAGQEMLHRELPALTAYLQSEKVSVNAVVVHPTAPQLQGGGAGMGGGSGGLTQQGGNNGGGHQKGVTDTAFDDADNEAVSYESLKGIGEDGASPLANYVGGGSWLSVRA